MKEVVLKFREVAVDGLPTESMDVLVLCGMLHEGRDRTEHFYNMTDIPFSKKYGAFNAYDYQKNDPGNSFNDVLFWIPTSEIDAMLEDSTNAD